MAIPDKTQDEELVAIDSNLPTGTLFATYQPDGTIKVIIADKQLTYEQARQLRKDLEFVLLRVHCWASRKELGE